MIRWVFSLSPSPSVSLSHTHTHTHTLTGIVNRQRMLNRGDHGVRALNYSSSPLSLCAYTIPSSCSHALVATQSSHTWPHTHFTTCLCDALTSASFNLALMADSSHSVSQRLCLFCLIFPVFPQHLLPSCPCLLPLCSVSRTLSPCFHLPLFEG